MGVILIYIVGFNFRMIIKGFYFYNKILVLQNGKNIQLPPKDMNEKPAPKHVCQICRE